jgi:hypothetical protein
VDRRSKATIDFVARRAGLSIASFACFGLCVARIALAVTEWRGALPPARAIGALGCAADQKHSGKSHNQQHRRNWIYILHLLISLKNGFRLQPSRCCQYFLLAELRSVACNGRISHFGHAVALACNSLAISARPLLDRRDN